MFIKGFVELFKFSRKRIPLRNLTLVKSGIDGRGGLTNKIIIRGRKGWVKQYYRIIDFCRILYNIPAIMSRFEYDANRNTFLVLLCYENGFLSYIVAPALVRVGWVIMAGYSVPLKIGNFLCVNRCPIGVLIHNLTVSGKSKFARSAGVGVQVSKKLSGYIMLRLPSKEDRLFNDAIFCTFGVVSNSVDKLRFNRKASDSLRCGFKQIVRGVAKNAIDHPHGGGSGRASSGIPSESPWGWYTKGRRTATTKSRFGGSLTWKILLRRRIKKQRKR